MIMIFFQNVSSKFLLKLDKMWPEKIYSQEIIDDFRKEGGGQILPPPALGRVDIDV